MQNNFNYIFKNFFNKKGLMDTLCISLRTDNLDFLISTMFLIGF